MRFIFKTNYAQDINTARHSGDRFWYSLLIILMLAMRFLIDDFYLFEGIREISAYLVLILTLIIYPRGLFSDKAEVKKV